MTQKTPPAIRSREQRSSAPDPQPQPDADGAAPEVERVREQALAMGYDLRRVPRSRRPRPQVRGGSVSMNCKLDPRVREAMEQAKLELNMNYSEMVNAGVVMFLKSQELRIDLDPLEFLPRE